MCTVHRILPVTFNNNMGIDVVTYEGHVKSRSAPSTDALIKGVTPCKAPRKEKSVAAVRPSHANQVFMKGATPILNQKKFKRSSKSWFKMTHGYLESELGDEVIEPRHQPIRMTRDQEVARARRKDCKTISRGEKVVKLIPGDKPHNHGKCIRRLKGNLKRGLN